MFTLVNLFWGIMACMMGERERWILWIAILRHTCGVKMTPRGMIYSVTLWMSPCRNSISDVIWWRFHLTLWRHFGDVIASNSCPISLLGLSLLLLMISWRFVFRFQCSKGQGIRSTYSHIRDLYGWPWNSRSGDFTHGLTNLHCLSICNSWDM